MFLRRKTLKINSQSSGPYPRSAVNFEQIIENSIIEMDRFKKNAIEADVDEKIIEKYEQVIGYLKTLKQFAESKYNYIKTFEVHIHQTVNIFRDADRITPILPVHNYQRETKNERKERLTDFVDNFDRQIEIIYKNLEFFEKFEFFRNNIVFIGANGSGKTSLSQDIKKNLSDNGVLIGAQKILIIPTISSIFSIEKTESNLRSLQIKDKTLKETYSTEDKGNAYTILSVVGKELEYAINNLLADRYYQLHQFEKNYQQEEEIPKTKLDKTFEIWNSLITHRKISLSENGISIILSTDNEKEYPAHTMSDGEKAILYYTAMVLQAPEDGFIVIDEPEMYLHKTILKDIWDTLENEREDCIFLYLTHDLDFAVSRTNAKKIWVQSFNYPNEWVFEQVQNENDLPEEMLLALLGSRKKILFCEGKKEGNDEEIYKNLFPNYTICSVGSCFDVIYYTKAFNRLKNVTVEAFGIIDSDYHEIERLESLKTDNVFSYSMSEIENLFLDEDFLEIIIQNTEADENALEQIKYECLAEFEKQKDLQISNFISTKIDNYFKDSNLAKGNSIKDVEKNYEEFTKKININEWKNNREEYLNKIISEKNYQEMLSVFNNKGLKTFANKHLKITNFDERAIKILRKEPDAKKALLKHFPDKLKD